MNSKVVLLVEDSDDDIELTLRSFAKHKLSNKIVVARNGQEALDYLFMKGNYATRDRVETPVVILLDLKLPKVDGLEVLHQIRAHPETKCIPVVVLTTSSQAKDKFESYNGGANSYIRKPVDFDQFMDVTQQLGIYWLMVNDPPLTTL
jgi:two-component system response regulator